MWAAIFLMGWIATGTVGMAAGPHLFSTEGACTDYLDDVFSTVKAANADRIDSAKLMMLGACLIADKRV